MEIRSYRPGDFDELLRLGNELDPYGQNMSATELRTSLGLPRNDPEDNVLLVTEDGEPVGYARVFRNRDLTINRHHIRLALPPRLRQDAAAVDRLLGRIELRLEEISSEYQSGLQVRLSCYDKLEDDLARAFERRGYRMVRYYARLDRQDIARLEPPEPPGTVTVRLLRPDEEAPEYLDVYNRAGRGGFDFHPLSLGLLEEHFTTSFFQPELNFVAVEGDIIVGYCENYLIPERERDGVRWGIVSDLGVVPEARGRGIGRALLRRGMLALRDAGAESVCLWMDYANPFGAKRLYYSEGFRDRYVTRQYARDEGGTADRHSV